MVEASVESAELKEHVIERPRRDEMQDLRGRAGEGEGGEDRLSGFEIWLPAVF